jgi:hypothetical protein
MFLTSSIILLSKTPALFFGTLLTTLTKHRSNANIFHQIYIGTKTPLYADVLSVNCVHMHKNKR